MQIRDEHRQWEDILASRIFWCCLHGDRYHRRHSLMNPGFFDLDFEKSDRKFDHVTKS
jgi:hypothetical protein